MVSGPDHGILIYMSRKQPLLVLVDGSAVFHRAYHALVHLSNAEGQPTNATYGFTNMLLKILSDLQPTYLVVAWDKSSDTFRKRLYPEYKAHRVRQPEDLYEQIPATRELSAAMGFPFIELDDYEADDVIGTLARQAGAHGGLEVVIATGDKDQLQLIDQHTVVDMFNPRIPIPTRYDLAKMREKYSMTPQQFIDYKALMGDPSDNIPGVAGIGDVGARKLLASYKSLDGIYEHLNEITGKTREYLEANKKMAYLSQELSTIVCDAPVKLDLESARVGNYDRQKLHQIFLSLGFKSLIAKLPPEARSQSDGTPSLFDTAQPPKERKHLKTANYQAVTTTDQLAKLAKELAKQSIVAIDTETTSVESSTTAKLVGLSLSWRAEQGYYIPVAHLEGSQLDWDEVLRALKSLLEGDKLAKLGHNIKFDYEVLARHGLKLGGITFDTMIAAFLLNPLGRTQSLDDLAYGQFGIEMIPITELIGSGKGQTTFDTVPVNEATTYAAEDADLTFRLYQVQSKELEVRVKEAVSFKGQKWTLARLLSDIEAPLISVLGDMELTGIELDKPFLNKFGGAVSKQILKLEKEICNLAGESFNINSPAQLSNILFQKLRLADGGIKKGKTGVSTAAAELEKLRGQHPIIDLLLEYRELTKLKTTYIDALPTLVATDGRIHTSFNQTIAQTGRLSSTNPNLQNIPVRTEVGREIRRAFVAPKGRVLISADYSQIELRVAAPIR